MKLIKFILLLALLYICMDATAQDNTENKSFNRTDAAGKRHGMWVLRMAERMGEPGSTEVGNYDHGSKIGPWYKLDGDGELQAMETYKNGVKDGEAKYFEGGHLVAVGQYRGLNPDHARDTFMVEDPVTGAQSLKSIATERGTMRHGQWRFYDAGSGRLMREEEYQVDELIYQKDFPMSKSDSLYYQKREAGMPHNKKTNYYKPPGSKQTKYTY
jgi:hypothetical protein